MNLQFKWRVQAGRVMVTGVTDPKVSAQMFGPTGFCPWEEFVQRGIADWRLMNPGDPRCDFRVADSVLDVAFRLKLISKAPDGKFLVPEWIGARSFQGVMDSLLGFSSGAGAGAPCGPLRAVHGSASS